MTPLAVASALNQELTKNGPLNISKANQIAQAITSMNCADFDIFLRQPLAVFIPTSSSGVIGEMTMDRQINTTSLIWEITRLDGLSPNQTNDDGLQSTANQSNIRDFLDIIIKAIVTHPCWEKFTP